MFFPPLFYCVSYLQVVAGTVTILSTLRCRGMAQGCRRKMVLIRYRLICVTKWQIFVSLTLLMWQSTMAITTSKGRFYLAYGFRELRSIIAEWRISREITSWSTAWSRERTSIESFEISECLPSSTPPLTRPHLLYLPKKVPPTGEQALKHVPQEAFSCQPSQSQWECCLFAKCWSV